MSCILMVHRNGNRRSTSFLLNKDHCWRFTKRPENKTKFPCKWQMEKFINYRQANIINLKLPLLKNLPRVLRQEQSLSILAIQPTRFLFLNKVFLPNLVFQLQNMENF